MSATDLVALDGNAVVIDGLDLDASSLRSQAVLRPSVTSRPLSAERVTLAWADRVTLEATERREGLRRISEVATAAGTVVLAEVPAATAETFGLAPDTRVGALLGHAHTCHQFFLRPMNRLPDVSAHFGEMELEDLPGGFRTHSSRHVLVTQQFRSDLPEGMLTIGAALGTPASSYRSARAGKMWVDLGTGGRRSVVLETPTVRLSLRPLGPVVNGGDPGAALSAAQERLGELRAAEWAS